MEALLAGRAAVVTGGGGGIGRGIAIRFASEGASVVVAEIDAKRAAETVAAIEADGGTAVAEVVDVCTPLGAAQAVERAVEAFGSVDVLINNVGHFGGARKPFHENTDEEWDELYQVNLGHVLRCTRAALIHMLERGSGGSIVNVSTIEAFRAIPTRGLFGVQGGGHRLHAQSRGRVRERGHTRERDRP